MRPTTPTVRSQSRSLWLCLLYVDFVDSAVQCAGGGGQYPGPSPTVTPTPSESPSPSPMPSPSPSPNVSPSPGAARNQVQRRIRADPYAASDRFPPCQAPDGPLPNMNTLKARPTPTTPRIPDPIPSTLCSPAQPDCVQVVHQGGQGQQGQTRRSTNQRYAAARHHRSRTFNLEKRATLKLRLQP